MSVLHQVMDLAEEMPHVKQLRKYIAQRERQLREIVSPEAWGVYLNLEAQWMEHCHATGQAVFSLAFLHGSQAEHSLEEVFQLDDVQKRQILVANECEDECMIWEGVQITERMAFVRVHHEQHLILCMIEPIPGSDVYRRTTPTDPLLKDHDSLYSMIADDMFELSFAQLARKHESFLMQALFAAITF